MQIFPRHVLAYMAAEGAPCGVAPASGVVPTMPKSSGWRPMDRDINELATSHKEVSIAMHAQTLQWTIA